MLDLSADSNLVEFGEVEQHALDVRLGGQEARRDLGRERLHSEDDAVNARCGNRCGLAFVRTRCSKSILVMSEPQQRQLDVYSLCRNHGTAQAKASSHD